MLKKYKIAIFDMDGTVIDSSPGVTASLTYALSKFGIEIKDKTELYKCIGPTLQYSFKNFFGLNETEIEEAIGYYDEYYEKQGVHDLFVYDGIPELIKNLKNAGLKIMLATSKQEHYARDILIEQGIYSLFDVIAGADKSVGRDEKTDIIIYALNSLNASAAESVMIGDRKYDVIGAKDVGCDCIGVLFGFGSKDELLNEGAAITCETCMDVEKYILG